MACRGSRSNQTVFDAKNPDVLSRTSLFSLSTPSNFVNIASCRLSSMRACSAVWPMTSSSAIVSLESTSRCHCCLLGDIVLDGRYGARPALDREIQIDFEPVGFCDIITAALYRIAAVIFRVKQLTLCIVRHALRYARTKVNRLDFPAHHPWPTLTLVITFCLLPRYTTRDFSETRIRGQL